MKRAHCRSSRANRGAKDIEGFKGSEVFRWAGIFRAFFKVSSERSLEEEEEEEEEEGVGS